MFVIQAERSPQPGSWGALPSSHTAQLVGFSDARSLSTDGALWSTACCPVIALRGVLMGNAPEIAAPWGTQTWDPVNIRLQGVRDAQMTQCRGVSLRAEEPAAPEMSGGLWPLGCSP